MNLASMQGKKFSLNGMIKESGLMSVYDGLGAGVWRQVFYASSRFGLFEICRDKLHDIRGKTDFAGRWVVSRVMHVMVVSTIGVVLVCTIYTFSNACTRLFQQIPQY